MREVFTDDPIAATLVRPRRRCPRPERGEPCAPRPSQTDRDFVLEGVFIAQEEERERFALDLRDSTVQHLVVLGLGVAQLRHLPRLSDKSRDVLEDMSNAIQTMLKDMRVHAHLMSSTNLDRDGFRSSAKALVMGFGGLSGLKVSFQGAGVLNGVPVELQRAALGVIQQALLNAYRRADPGAVSVEIFHRSDVLTVRVADTGKGGGGGRFDEAASGAITPGVQARVRHLRGVLDVSSEASVTVIEARIPS